MTAGLSFNTPREPKIEIPVHNVIDERNDRGGSLFGEDDDFCFWSLIRLSVPFLKRHWSAKDIPLWLPATWGGPVDRLKDCIPELLITRTYVEGLPGHEAAMYCARSARD